MTLAKLLKLFETYPANDVPQPRNISVQGWNSLSNLALGAIDIMDVPLSTMSTSREGPNPLRPYYVPPSVGNPPKIATTANIGSRNGSSPTTSPSFGSSARNILAEMDYSEYLSDTSPSSTATIKTIAEQAIWKYSSVFLAQPFEVAKTVLQVRAPSSGQKGSFQGSAADSARMKRMQYRTDDIYRDYEVWTPS